MGKYQTIKGQKNSSETVGTNEWFTPLEIIYNIQDFYQKTGFLDAASSDLAQEYVAATKYFTEKDNSLHKIWDYHSIWLNPPYSYPEIRRFVRKALFEFFKMRSCKEITLLVNANTETQWFQELAQECSVRIDICGRLKFWHPNKKMGRNPSGQCLFYFGDRTTEFINQFGKLGLAYRKPLQ